MDAIESARPVVAEQQGGGVTDAMFEAAARALVPFSYGAFEQHGTETTPFEPGKPNANAYNACRAVIAALSPAEPGIEGDAKPVAWVCAADIKLVAERDGYDISVSPRPRPELGMKMPLYAALTHPALLKECREVLRPFAKMANARDDEEPDDTVMDWNDDDASLTLGQCRTARTLLTKLEAAR